jgi:hypothetical protein
MACLVLPLLLSCEVFLFKIGFGIHISLAETRKSSTLKKFPQNNQELEQMEKQYFLGILPGTLRNTTKKMHNCQNGIIKDLT